MGISRQVATNRFNMLRKKYPPQALAEMGQRAKGTASPSKSRETTRKEADGDNDNTV